MVNKIIWRKFRLYKRFELDVWGFNTVDPNKESKIFKMFAGWHFEKKDWLAQLNRRYIYRIDLEEPSRVIKRQKIKFVRHKLTRLFYLTLSFRQFRRLMKEAGRKEGSFEGNFIILVEGRIICMLYRMQFLMNVFDLRYFVLNRNVMVNSRVLTYVNASVNMYDIVQVKPILRTNIKLQIIERFSRGGFYFNIPRHMIVSYKLMFGTIYIEPRVDNLSFPLKVIDIYRGADLA